jgi:enamine deaminase RidA (YjgF/YER057c/UK114 family)
VGNAERRLKELGIELPVENVRGTLPLRQVGDLIFMSGHGCELPEGGLIYEGKLGAELTVEEGYKAARHVGINLLAALKHYLGDLDRVAEIVKVLGFVASTPDFHDQVAVMHGFSDLMVQVFGERGKHARSAIGTNVLPNNQPVEIEMIVRIRD